MASEIFLSYTTIKDLYGAVSSFQEHLEHEVRMKSGDTEISVFQDKKNIRFGEDFKDALGRELESVKVLVILLSPTWLNSKWCRWEYQQFAKTGKPIVVVKWDDINEETLTQEGKVIFRELKKLHYLDWGDLKYADWKSKAENMAAAKLATEIVNYLNEFLLNEEGPDSEDTLVDSFNSNPNISIVRIEPFEAHVATKNYGNIMVYRLRKNGNELLYGEVLELWETDNDFLDFYISLFKKCGFESYVWETPPISNNTVNRPFEFVILNSPISSNQPDYKRYKKYYDLTKEEGIVSFPNLGHDATLVVPSPYNSDVNYSDLSCFFRESPVNQQRSIWKVTARELKQALSTEPIWLSVAGGGIAWLHIRLDSRPKYYSYLEYTEI